MRRRIAALAQYCKSLEQQVVELRHDVNRLTSPGQEKPFFRMCTAIYTRRLTT